MTGNPPIEEVYFDRNQVVLAFARLAQHRGWRVGVRVLTEDPDWPVLYVDTPAGQVSWHVPRAEIVLSDWPEYSGIWDGHSVQERRQRVARLANASRDDRPARP